MAWRVADDPRAVGVESSATGTVELGSLDLLTCVPIRVRVLAAELVRPPIGARLMLNPRRNLFGRVQLPDVPVDRAGTALPPEDRTFLVAVKSDSEFVLGQLAVGSRQGVEPFELRIEQSRRSRSADA